MFGAEVSWPPSKHDINRSRGDYNHTRRLSEFKLGSNAAVLSCTERQGLCYECLDRLTPAESALLDTRKTQCYWPKLKGGELWECTDNTCTTCTMFQSAPRVSECKLCLGTELVSELEKPWCQYLKATQQWTAFKSRRDTLISYTERLKAQEAEHALNKLAFAIQRKATARARQLQQLAAEASRRQLGGGDVQRFAERCQGELIALGKRVKRQRREDNYTT